MQIKYKECSLGKKSLNELKLINSIVADYQNQGYTLTLRQLYYQLVSRDIIANDDKQYKKLSRLLTEGRMAGLVDWGAIEDRLRQVQTVSTWKTPKDVLESALYSYRRNRLKGQKTYIEVWVEKDALSQVVWKAASKYQVPVMVNRGYGSSSAMHDAFERIALESKLGEKNSIILYLGDHDPSGLDMVRDVEDRLKFFMAKDGIEDTLTVKHIALTMSQIRQYNPPPNPAKLSDVRAADYVTKFGNNSWEVDALDPSILNTLIVTELEKYIDLDLYQKELDIETEEKKRIKSLIEKNF